MMKYFIVPFILFNTLKVYGQDTLHLFFTGSINGVIKSEYPEAHGDILRIEAAMQPWTADSVLREKTLLFDSGDALAYHYLSKLDKGRTLFRHMRRAGYDGMVVGNFDFQYGLEQLDLLKGLDSNFTFLATNIFKRDSSYLLMPYRIFEKNGVKVGVLGLVEEQLMSQLYKDEKDRIYMVSPVDALRQVLPVLRSRCDIVIAINHMDVHDNLNLSREVPGLDVLVGKPSDDSLKFLKVYDNHNRPRSIIVNAPLNALEIGRISLQLEREDSGFQLVNADYEEPLDLTEMSFDSIDLTDYRRLEEIFHEYTIRRHQGFEPDEPLVPFAGRPAQEIMDYTLYAMLRSTHSEIAFLNNGALTAPGSGFGRDSLTVRDLESVTRPYDPLVTIRLKGKDIKSIINRSRQFGEESGKYLHMLAVGDYSQTVPRDLKPHGFKLDDNEVYAVTTTSYVAEGGDGYTGFTKATHKRYRFLGDLRLTASTSPLARPVLLSDLLTWYLVAGIHPDFSEEQVYYQKEKLLNKSLWVVNFQNVDFSYKNVRVSNNEDFDKASDTRVSSTTQDATNIATAGYIAGVRRTSKARWENGMLWRYAFQQIGQSQLQESDDRLEFQTILDWDDLYRIRPIGAMNLYSSFRYETQFSPSEDAEGNKIPTRKNAFLYLGVSRFGKLNREFRLAFFGKNDFATGKWDAGFEMNFKYFKEFSWGKHGSILRARYLFNRPDRNPGEEKALIDYTGYLQFSIINFINLKPQINLFVFQDMALKKVATNLQFSVNLTFSRLWKPQYIRFWRSNR